MPPYEYVYDPATKLKSKSTTGTMASPAPPAAAAPSLNLYEKIAVIRLPSDTLTYEDAAGNQKSVMVEELEGAIASAVRFCCWQTLNVFQCVAQL